MQRIIRLSQSYILEIVYHLLIKVRNVFFVVFPFLKRQHASEEHGLNFENSADYLFLPEILSTKKYLYPETLSLLITLGTCFAIVVYVCVRLFSSSTIIVVSGFVASLYFVLLLFKLWVVKASLSFPLIDFTKEEIDAITDEELPVYTIFVPLRYEAEVIPQIIEAMTSLDYPKEKINLIVPLEEYDHETIAAIKNANPPKHFKPYILPYVEPQTKPKTMNIVFKEARGEFLVIYDAEIIPDADQMKKAYLAFKKYPEIAALQTRLDHYNYNQNVITKLFNMEFSFYYDYFLPGLQKLGFPIPLSGHSTHFRLDALRDVGAWDPYNVAEDCEIGIRLYRNGYRSGILNSTSREEAASSLWSWVKQRTRWMKGFIQTSIVHLRYPVRFKNEVGGWKNLFAFLLIVPGTVLVNIINLLSWIVLGLWFITHATIIQSWYPTPILYISATSFIVGTFLFTYFNLIGSYKRQRFHLVKYGLLTPLYWLLLAFATTRAAYQITISPKQHSWEKTMHGTHLQQSVKVV